MYSETITLFNRYHSRLGDIWYPHILKNVNLITDKASIIAKHGTDANDTASLHIKYNEIDGKVIIDRLTWMPPKEWSKQLNEELIKSITFNDNASLFDFFILGEYESSEPIEDDYTEGFYNYMDMTHDYCYAITSVSNPYKVIPHFEIMAR